MTVPLALLLYAACTAVVCPRLLLRSTWLYSAPRWGILVWQCAVVAVLGSLALLALTAVLPFDVVSFDLGHLLHACATVLSQRYALHRDRWVAAVSLLAAGTTAALLLRAVGQRTLAVARTRRRQRTLIDLLARDRNGHGAHVLAHKVPLAYCIPGGVGRIVLTTAAVEALGGAELSAVIEHEKAHLRGRHDMVLFGVDVAHSAFPWMGFFRTARAQIAALVEMLADDRAARATGRLALATALVDLGCARAPDGGLGASGHMTVERVQRLVDGERYPSWGRRGLLLLLSVVLVAAPVVISTAPALAARSGLCPFPSS